MTTVTIEQKVISVTIEQVIGDGEPSEARVTSTGVKSVLVESSSFQDPLRDLVTVFEDAMNE